MNAADTAFLAALVVALWAVCRDCYGRGKVLTMPLRRRVRLFDLMPLLCRFTQNTASSLVLWWIPRTGWGALVFWGVWVAPYRRRSPDRQRRPVEAVEGRRGKRGAVADGATSAAGARDRMMLAGRVREAALDRETAT